MLRIKALSVTLLALTIAGCGQTQFVSRNKVDPELLRLDSSAFQEQQLTEQAEALDRITKELVQRATVKGAAIGAAAGCGLAVISVSEGGKCLAGALAGGAFGAVAGNAAGKRQAQARVEMVSLSRVTPTIGEAQKQMAAVSDGLPAMLATQNEELATLKTRLAAGEIDQATFDARLTEIRNTRAEVAQSLTQSAEQARTTANVLKEAGAQGQEGLDWHIMSVETLEDEAVSARSRIELL